MPTKVFHSIEDELNALRKENAELKALLLKHGIKYEPKETDKEVCVYSPLVFSPSGLGTEESRISLFKSLFRGREDVYANRWESATSGKSGYLPICRNNGRPGICNKRQYRCTECPNRDFTPLNYSAIRNHLMGQSKQCNDVIGLYPIMSDNTCCFLCTDFDDKSCKQFFCVHHVFVFYFVR